MYIEGDSYMVVSSSYFRSAQMSSCMITYATVICYFRFP